jgi:hypothetical protein
LDGYVNIDIDPLFGADMVFDLEKPWPLDTSSVQQIMAHHVMEHLGETVHAFIAVIQEMYRVSADGCEWLITVPDPNSDVFGIDPTHVRRITPATMRMFDQADNLQDLMNHGHYTKLGMMHGIDVEVQEETVLPLEPYLSKLQRNEISIEDLDFMARHYRNVAQEISMRCRVHKPQRYGREFLHKFRG